MADNGEGHAAVVFVAFFLMFLAMMVLTSEGSSAAEGTLGWGTVCAAALLLLVALAIGVVVYHRTFRRRVRVRIRKVRREPQA